ncbi:rod shape-determining protein [Streptomyces sp. DSM 42041]|uniref:Rod shape-determining protein n=2 Tax=Streptomyces hazeniae TaxID=3075538 RepID=A0ABU2NWJ2_9ACTN|nr:rod shape-determining protein [Streptomyces sp. DSM 42041]MDT0380976.1 rod shape-determining protein [Streptomyces sp. DSM 42041]
MRLPVSRLRPGLALDLGSARTRAWVPGRGVILDVPTVTFSGIGAVYPVQRGTIIDTEGAARMLDRLLGRAFPRFVRPLIVLTTPVLGGPAHRSSAHAALAVLRPRAVLTVPGPRAVALAADGDRPGAALVVDVGAHLTEVALLVDGAVTDAYRTALGVTDLDGCATAAELGEAVAKMVKQVLRHDHTGLSLDAVRRGLLLAGGGALRPECVHAIAARLKASVQPVAAPHTAALRGAARLLESAHGHPSAAP